MNTENRTMSAFRFRNALSLLAIALLATGLLAACAGDGDAAEMAAALTEVEQQVAELQAQVEQMSQALGTGEPSGGGKGGVTVRVEPAIFKFPARQLSGAGDVWFYGSGLEPGQWFRIKVFSDGEVGEIMEFASDTLRQASEDGSFALATPSIRPDRFQGIPEAWGLRGGVWTVELWDMDTGAVLASTPWVVCGSEGENPWCEAAVETAIVPEPVVAGAGTIYQVDRISIEDGKFEFRLAADAYWGYEADAQLFSDEVDILITVKVGDTLKMETLAVSGSRSTKPHNLTIEGMGIDFSPEGRDPYEIKFEMAGTFAVDDSTDPGEHGKFVIVVEE